MRGLKHHRAFLAALLVGLAASAAAAPAAAVEAAAPKASTATATTAAAGVKSSTAAPSVTPADLYGGGKLRDPFAPLLGAGGVGAAMQVVAPAAFNMEEFSIHGLDLKGIMKDPKGSFAVLVETKSGTGFILRDGRLYDYKGKPVAGVTGVIRPRQKSVMLQTPDRDVQWLRLGEKEDEEDPARGPEPAAAGGKQP